ncbi:RNA polymerase factor sigma-54 [Deferribacterales bacterium RsTz2092]
MNRMNLGIGLATANRQKLFLSQKMKHSLELLQMPVAELAQELSEYIQNNPILEIDDTAKHPDDIKHEEWDGYHRSTKRLDDDFNQEQAISANTSLSEHLLFQLKTAGLADDDVRIGLEIIGNLSEDGYFRADIEEIARDCNVMLAQVENVLDKIKTFEPVGVASQNFTECVIAQLPQIGALPKDVEKIKHLLDNCSTELATYKYDDITKKTGLSRNNLNELLELVRRIDPKPGLSFNETSQNIVPDVFIVRKGDRFEVLVNDTWLPKVHLNSYYVNAAKSKEFDAATKTYLAEKVAGAKWILHSLRNRHQTMYKVAKALIEEQREFLLYGNSHLKPLRLRDIANVTGLHESTVSRITNGKYAQMEHGVIELKKFFSKGMDGEDGNISTRHIKQLIQEVIAAEPVSKPYSDEKIVGLLKGQGVDLARRTVAKYREELKIPTMSMRRRIKG